MNLVGNSERVQFKQFQGELLRQQDVTLGQRVLRIEAQTADNETGFVDLAHIHGGTIADAIKIAGRAADDVEKSTLRKKLELVRRKVFFKQPVSS